MTDEDILVVPLIVKMSDTLNEDPAKDCPNNIIHTQESNQCFRYRFGAEEAHCQAKANDQKICNWVCEVLFGIVH